VYQASSHDGGAGLFVAQVDGLIDGQQFEAGIGGGKGHNAEQFKPVSLYGHTGYYLDGISVSQLTFMTLPGGLGNDLQSL
jgi:hypothetical protein